MSSSAAQAQPSSPAFTTALTLDDNLDEICEQLQPARTEWFNIGLKLKVDHETLKEIKKIYHGDCKEGLREMLTERFSKSKPSLTWRELCTALRSPIVKRMDVADTVEKHVQSKQGKSVTTAASSSSTSTGRKRKSDPGSPESGCSKKLKESPKIKQGTINDGVLMKIGQEIGSRWIEVGIALGLTFNDLKNRIDDNIATPNHLKPLNMLQEWKSAAAGLFTYEKLASALEQEGLNTCAQTHCYTEDAVTENEQ